MIEFNIISIFPETFTSFLENTIIKKAIQQKLCKVNFIDLKKFGRYIDDKPYGGGNGMIIKADIIAQAIDLIKDYDKIIYFSPRGEVLHQEIIESHINFKKYILICGRYEGIDQRVIDEYNIEEISIGNFVLSCGEIPAILFIDSLIRLVPNIVGKKESVENDSFSKTYNRKIEYPLYTMPKIWRGRSVPDVLLSGHHKNIELWKKNNFK